MSGVATGPPTKANAPQADPAARSSLPTKRAADSVAITPEQRKAWEARLEAEGLGTVKPTTKLAYDDTRQAEAPPIGARLKTWRAWCKWRFRERFGRDWAAVALTRETIDATMPRYKRTHNVRSWRAALVVHLDTYGLMFRVLATWKRRVWVERLPDGSARPLPESGPRSASGPVELIETDEDVTGYVEMTLPKMRMGTRVQRLDGLPRKGEKRRPVTLEMAVMDADHMLTARDLALIAALLGYVKFQGNDYEKRLARETAAMEKQIRLHGRRPGGGATVRGPAAEKPGSGTRAKYPKK